MPIGTFASNGLRLDDVSTDTKLKSYNLNCYTKFLSQPKVKF